MRKDMKPEIEFLCSRGCPHAEEALRLTRAVLERLLPGREVAPVIVETDEEARSREFPGSPTIRVDGIDIEETMAAFRGTRDELRRRLEILFRGWNGPESRKGEFRWAT